MKPVVKIIRPFVKIIATSAVVLAALGMIAYKYLDYMRYPWTRDGLVRAQVVQIIPRVSGALVQVPIQNNQLVKKGDLLFEIDPRTFQAAVNLARAQFDNMRDIVKSLAEQVDGMRSNVDLREAELRQARFDVEGLAAEEENALIVLGRAKELLPSGFSTPRDVDDKNAAYQMALAKLDTAKAKVIQMAAAVAQAKDDLARSIADLGTLGEDNPRLRRAAADLEIAQLNLDFTKVWAPTDGYVTNLQLHAGDSVVANQPTVALIDANSFYVQAFFRETFMSNFEKGIGPLSR
jgi:multidrug resistance efflux pump